MPCPILRFGLENLHSTTLTSNIICDTLDSDISRLWVLPGIKRANLLYGEQGLIILNWPKTLVKNTQKVTAVFHSSQVLLYPLTDFLQRQNGNMQLRRSSELNGLRSYKRISASIHGTDMQSGIHMESKWDLCWPTLKEAVVTMPVLPVALTMAL